MTKTMNANSKKRIVFIINPISGVGKYKTVEKSH